MIKVASAAIRLDEQNAGGEEAYEGGGSGGGGGRGARSGGSGGASSDPSSQAPFRFTPPPAERKRASCAAGGGGGHGAGGRQMWRATIDWAVHEYLALWHSDVSDALNVDTVRRTRTLAPPLLLPRPCSSRSRCARQTHVLLSFARTAETTPSRNDGHPSSSLQMGDGERGSARERRMADAARRTGAGCGNLGRLERTRSLPSPSSSPRCGGCVTRALRRASRPSPRGNAISTAATVADPRHQMLETLPAGEQDAIRAEAESLLEVSSKGRASYQKGALSSVEVKLS